MALVIGNSAYRDAPLKNPVNDARAIAEALKASGFVVTKLENATREQMVAALREFGNRILGGGVGLFYYAGHGMQVKGKNYLVPVNADIASEDEVAYNTLDADAVLAKMETAKTRLNLLILDACRNNPFGRSFRSSSQGLAQMDAPAGSFIAFATAPGHTAADGSGSNGLYTQHLLTQLHASGLKVEDVFKRVRASVMQESKGQQVPWESSSITGDFFFAPSAASPMPEGTMISAISEATTVELAYWDSIKHSSNALDFKAYLTKYPSGKFLDLAKNRLDSLATPAAPVTAALPLEDSSSLLKRCLEARGGVAALKAVKSLRLRGKSKVMEGITAPFFRELLAPNRWRMETQLPEVSGILIVTSDGNQTWTKGLSTDRKQILEPARLTSEEESKASGRFFGLQDPMLLCTDGLARLLVSSEIVKASDGGLPQFQIQLSGGGHARYILDPVTHLPARCRYRFPTNNGDDMDMELKFGDYRKVGGIQIPFRTEQFDEATKTWNSRETLEEVEFQPTLSAASFEVPTDVLPAGRPKPPPAVVASSDAFDPTTANVDALFQEGFNCLHGIDRPMDKEKAGTYFRDATAKGHIPSMNALALMYGTGDGVPKDESQAAQWYKQAAEAGSTDSMVEYGLICESGKGVPSNAEEAVRWYRKAAEKGHAQAQKFLGVMYEFGQGVEKDYAKAASWYRQSAEQNWPDGAFAYGVMCVNGTGTKQNDVEGVRWYRKAAEAGHALAANNLGWMYEKGRGVSRDEKQAAQWYRKAAEGGDSIGQCNFGWVCEAGKGVPMDLKQAVIWYRKSADQGNAIGQKSLGVMLRDGLGTDKNEVEAVKWFRASAEQGNVDAQVALGLMISNGLGTPKDDAQMVAWFRKAADAGSANGQSCLGWAYESGRGVPANERLAIQWHRKAAQQGNEESKEALKRLGQK